jgi:hypothetical protein
MCYEITRVKPHFRKLWEVQAPGLAQWLGMVRERLCMGYPSGFALLALQGESSPVSLVSPSDPSLAFLAHQPLDALHALEVGSSELLLCFSVVSPASFQNVWEKWVPEVRRRCPQAPLLLVGTQCDLRQDVKVLIELARRRERPVPEQDARALADKVGAVGYVECSAKFNWHVVLLFKELLGSAVARGMRQNHTSIRLQGALHEVEAQLQGMQHTFSKVNSI